MTESPVPSPQPSVLGPRRAVFLDKDGTLVEDVPYNVEPERIRLAAGAAEALRALHAAGYRLIVISNQSGVARGYFAEGALAAIEQRLRELLGRLGVPLAGFYHCPHHPDGSVAEYAVACDCRKPRPGLLLRAARDHGLDLARSWFVGDILNDVEAGRRAGCRTVLIDGGSETEWTLAPERLPHHIVADLAEAARIITSSEGRGARSEGSRPRSSLAPRYSPPRRLRRLVERFAGLELLVIGEAMLDTYLEGLSERLCREAPVPIVDVTARTDLPGGAANAAANVAGLGARARFLSVVGDDPEGGLLRRALADCGVVTDDVLTQPARRTLAKVRVSAAGHLLVRFDQGSTEPIAGAVEDELIRRLAEAFPRADAVVVSDYGYGILTPRVIVALGQLQASAPRTVVVDSKDLAAYRDVGVTAAKPNYAEALALLGARGPGNGARADALVAAGGRLLERTGARLVAVTLDTEGAVLFERGGATYRTHARPTTHARAAGAGDTFGSALALALAAGADAPAAAELAATAAGVVVAKQGTVACSAEELREHLAASGAGHGWAERLS